MKVLSWILGLIITLLTSIYVLAFTPIGNSILAPILENKINELGKLNSKLATFTLTMDEFEILFELDNSNSIYSKGTYSLFSKSVDLNYDIKLGKLENLQELLKAQVKGAFNTNGTVKGNLELIKIDGSSDLAKSDTIYNVELTEFNPTSIIAKVKNANLALLLEMVGQKAYANAGLNLDVNLKNIKPHQLDGDLKLTTVNGKINSKIVNKDFNLTMPKSKFSLNLDTKLNNDLVNSKLDLKSSIANFHIKKAILNTNDNSIVSDYKIYISNLNNLYFVTKQKMRGSFSANGELKKGKDLDLSVHSKIADGKIDAKLHNDDLHADIKSVQTLKVLHILYYPEVFKSSLNAKLDYNLVKQKGRFNGNLLDGKFTQNQMLNLLRDVAKINLYKENFKGDVSADINKENILASLNFKSNKSSITTKNSKINSKTKAVDSKIDIIANKNPLTVKITGTTDKPKIDLDASALIKSQVKGEINKQIDKKLKGEVGDLLKSLF